MYRLKLLDIVLNLGFTFLVCEYQNVVQMCPELTKLLAKLDKVLTPNGALKVERGPKEDERVG